MFFGMLTIDNDGFSMVLGLSNHWFQWFSMVKDHWSNDGMVSMDRTGLHPYIVDGFTWRQEKAGYQGTHCLAIASGNTAKNVVDISAKYGRSYYVTVG